MCVGAAFASSETKYNCDLPLNERQTSDRSQVFSCGFIYRFQYCMDNLTMPNQTFPFRYRRGVHLHIHIHTHSIQFGPTVDRYIQWNNRINWNYSSPASFCFRCTDEIQWHLFEQIKFNMKYQCRRLRVIRVTTILRSANANDMLRYHMCVAQWRWLLCM